VALHQRGFTGSVARQRAMRSQASLSILLNTWIVDGRDVCVHGREHWNRAKDTQLEDTSIR
jgi:hypothetical protein